jgi:hypothetical protein
MPGYIYLIMMADGVYKVGRTQQDYGNSLKRLKAYPGDSIIAMVLKVHDDVVVEKEVLRRCRLAFGVHPRGLEYFRGPEDEFMKIIYECKNFTARPPPLPVNYGETAVERYLHGLNTELQDDLYAPLCVLEELYEWYCKFNKITVIDFRTNCPLPIIRLEGSLTWTPINNESRLFFENPEVVLGVNVYSYSPSKKSQLKA